MAYSRSRFEIQNSATMTLVHFETETLHVRGFRVEAPTWQGASKKYGSALTEIKL